MAWIVGIDEAGYGPNLGPFVMTSVACRVPDSCRPANLWDLLRPAIRRLADEDEGQLLIDDSKLVYTARGLAGLEQGVFTAFGHESLGIPDALNGLIDHLCPDDGDELRREAWYRGVLALPVHRMPEDVRLGSSRFRDACTASKVGDWQVRSAVICPARFNSLLTCGGTKGHILAHALTNLIHWQRDNLAGEDDLVFFIDKHGGRNFYAAMIQHALPDGIVFTERESLACSAYRVHNLDREMRLVFQPRADAEHPCVALASMTSKYLREVLMLEFNRFWQEHVPDLRPTAGYPGDAARFFHAIRPTIAELGLREESLWRRK